MNMSLVPAVKLQSDRLYTKFDCTDKFLNRTVVVIIDIEVIWLILPTILRRIAKRKKWPPNRVPLSQITSFGSIPLRASRSS